MNQIKREKEGTPKSNLRARLCVTLFFAFLLILFDQWTKARAVDALADGRTIVLIPNILELLYVQNFGAAFGIFQGKQWMFSLIAVLVCAGLMYFIARMPAGRRYLPIHIAFIFVIAGAIGNLVDRIRHVYVVDFIYFKPIDFPVFNVADIYITCACAVLIVLLLFVYRHDDLSFIGFGEENAV